MIETTRKFTIQLNNGTTTKAITTPSDITAANIAKAHCTLFLSAYQNAIDSAATIKNAFYLTTEREHIDLT